MSFKRDLIETFDSYGDDISKYYKIKYPPGGIVKENCTAFQSLESSACGHFCIYFVYKRLCGYSYECIMNSFSKTNKNFNDCMVRNFVEKLKFRFKLGNVRSSKHRKDLQKCCSRTYTN